MTAEAALVALLQNLSARQYRWTTPTPETQRRVRARPDRRIATDLPGIFGWSLPFVPASVDPQILALMRTGGIVVERGNLLASTVRVSSLGDVLFLHSAYPTAESDAVFFGPDTYRFARFIEAGISGLSTPIGRLIDIGCGSGAGAIMAARAAHAAEIVMTDVNPQALRLARINAAGAGIDARTATSDILRDVEGSFDLIVSNPPYLIDDDRRAYRHGGDALGADLSLRIAREAADRLNVDGRLLLYTASAIVDGVDGFRAAVMPLLQERHCAVEYEEIDPDVFGEELERPAYRTVDRIAVVGVRAIKRGLQ
jgi:methylase of polypeptide subunit release factors